MSTYDLPDWFSAAAWELIFNRATVGLENSMNGLGQSVDLLAWYWGARATLPPCAPGSAEAGAREAFFNLLAGGVDKVKLWHRFRPAPLGTLRGSPTLASSVAQFSDTLVLANAWDTSRQNMLLWSEDMTAAAWAGTTVVANGATAPDGTITADLVDLPTDANTRLDQTTATAAAAGAQYVYSVWLRGAGTCRITLNTTTGVGGAFEKAVVLTGSWVRHEISGSFLPGVSGNVRVHGVIRRGGDTATQVAMWGAQLEIGGVATDYIRTTSVAAGAPVTLKSGDMIGVAPQLFQVRDDSVSNSLGQMTVKVVNRTRTSLASGLPVVWDRPTATFVTPDRAAIARYTPNLAAGHSIELREAP